MSKLALTPNGAGTGTYTLASPNNNASHTLTLPVATGTLLTSAGDGSALTSLTSGNLTGALPAIDGSALTGVYGQGQTLQDMSASRVSGTSYRNTTGKTIFVGIEKRGGGGDLQYSTNNSTWISVAGWPTASGSFEEYYAGLPIPHNTYYRISSGGYEKWTELR